MPHCAAVSISKNDAEEDTFAEFEATMRDCIDVWSECGASLRRDTEREFQRMIEVLRTLGLIVAAGTHTQRLRRIDAQGPSITMSITLRARGYCAA
jgi:hypothetical protein